MREINCHSYGDARLRPKTLCVTAAGRDIAEVTGLFIGEAFEYLNTLSLSERETRIVKCVVKEIQERPCFLLDVGLDYLTLLRSAGSLSGGKTQRIRLATQIGSGLVGVLYVLDEPSTGLRRRDNRRLIEALVRLWNLGSTLVIIEHDKDTVQVADWVVDIGPGAGEHGGEITVFESVEELLTTKESLTGRYLSGKLVTDAPAVRRPRGGKPVTVVDASENDLQDVDISFPLGRLAAMTEVSGSGKSSLVNPILYTAVAKQVYGAKAVPGRYRKLKSLENLDKVIQVDQSPISHTPRSNPVIYTGIFGKIHGLFTTTPKAEACGYLSGRFSLNVRGGCCKNCSDDGTVKIEIDFLPDVYVLCEIYHGARYNRETLEVRYKGRSILDVLQMSTSEGTRFFESIPAIVRHLKTLEEVGLDYVHLGQLATTLSGGEAQRVKLAAELQKRSTGRTLYVLDEPTTGLHFEDIRKLLVVLHCLVDAGDTVVVIEHNLDAIKSADQIIDMGPGDGSRDGQVVATGTPEEVTRVAELATGEFLTPLLEH